LRVILDHRLFFSEEHVADLTALLLNANSKPHQIIVAGGMAGQTASLAWLERRDSALCRPLEQILARGRSPEMLRKPPGLVLEVSNERDETISSDGWSAIAHLGRAKEFVGRPLDLWLENGRNDSAFLRASAPAGEYRRWLEDAHTKRWIKYCLGGGSELGRVLEALDPWDRLRAWAMCDADNWEPAYVSAQVRTFRAACAARLDPAPRPELPLCVLRRRAIENYLPLRALRRWATLRHGTRSEQRRKRKRFVDKFEGLHADDSDFELRHHYHLERGFKAEPQNIPSAYDPFRVDAVLQEGAGSPIKKIYAEDLEDRNRAGHGWIDDAWWAEDVALREEIVSIIASIQRRI